jgi:hypothetical protein
LRWRAAFEPAPAGATDTTLTRVMLSPPSIITLSVVKAGTALRQ